MKNFLVTSCGFIAYNLILFLLQKGNVFVTGPTENVVPHGAEVVADRFQKLNFRDLPHIDCLFHQAACTDTTNLDESYQMRVNCYDALELMIDATCNDVGHIVYASSASVYGSLQPPQSEHDPTDPLNPYAVSKARLERFVGNLNWPATGLRYSNVYGTNEDHKGTAKSYLHQMVDQFKKTGEVKLFHDGNQRRDWVHVDDVVQANWLAFQTREQGVFNVGSGECASFNEIADFLGAVKTYIPNPHQGYQSHTHLDQLSSRLSLGYVPKVKIREGLAMLIVPWTNR